MSMKPSLGSHTLNVQAVELRTGVTAETLRTWERRYGWPRPQRLANGYRMYSEDDVALILAVKRELDSGVTAATAWQRVLSTWRQSGASNEARSPAILRDLLEGALLAFRPEEARMLIGEAHALYPLERVLTEVISGVLVKIGEGWHRGAVTIAQEHFATNVVREVLTTIGQSFQARPGAPTVMVGAPQGEMHDLGALMLSVLLRRSGYVVLFLGQNLPIDQLAEALAQARPQALILSATRQETARGLVEFATVIRQMPPPRPLLAFGGRAFTQHPEIIDTIDGHYIPGDAIQATAHLRQLLDARIAEA
jgi:methanogenic corrinoid protein MtbC1